MNFDFMYYLVYIHGKYYKESLYMIKFIIII